MEKNGFVPSEAPRPPALPMARVGDVLGGEVVWQSSQDMGLGGPALILGASDLTSLSCSFLSWKRGNDREPPLGLF